MPHTSTSSSSRKNRLHTRVGGLETRQAIDKPMACLDRCLTIDRGDNGLSVVRAGAWLDDNKIAIEKAFADHRAAPDTERKRGVWSTDEINRHSESPLGFQGLNGRTSRRYQIIPDFLLSSGQCYDSEQKANQADWRSMVPLSVCFHCQSRVLVIGAAGDTERNESQDEA